MGTQYFSEDKIESSLQPRLFLRPWAGCGAIVQVTEQNCQEPSKHSKA